MGKQYKYFFPDPKTGKWKWRHHVAQWNGLHFPSSTDRSCHFGLDAEILQPCEGYTRCRAGLRYTYLYPTCYLSLIFYPVHGSPICTDMCLTLRSKTFDRTIFATMYGTVAAPRAGGRKAWVPTSTMWLWDDGLCTLCHQKSTRS